MIIEMTHWNRHTRLKPFCFEDDEPKNLDIYTNTSFMPICTTSIDSFIIISDPLKTETP